MQIVYQNVPYDIADAPAGGTYFVFGIRKSGSSILNSIVAALAQRAGVNFVDVAGKLFDAGVKVSAWRADPQLARIVRPGNAYGGFRDFPEGLVGNPAFESARKVLLVRDPRDALVSEYFSNAFSHSLPQQGEGRNQMLELRKEALQSPIEEFVVHRAPEFAKTLRQYMPLLSDRATRVMKYEDFIPNKRVHIGQIAEFFGWNIDAQYVSLVLSWADVLPSEERPTEFVRKVTPGDHRDKLGRSTIDRLNELLETEMKEFGYAAD
jgi:hypothetical protein